MPNEPIDFILVRDRSTGHTKYIPRTKYEAQRDLWAQVAGGKTVRADHAPTYEASPTTTGGGSKSSGHSADTMKES